MEKEQQLEWEEAQKLVINVDIVAATKQHLEFLATVDRNRWLYDGPGLKMAIYRYNSCWLPMLAKHSEFPFFEGPLVVPLDCEWIWHCHRLNPVRYKFDCEQLYGRLLDNYNVVSSLKKLSTRETEEIWKYLYPNEPYDLDSARALSDNIPAQIPGSVKCTNCDLVAAVKWQSPFYYQVSRPHMNNDRYLEGAVARYKGFLHLFRRKWERSANSVFVPTPDMDLIWHTHQLHPVSYCKDLIGITGEVLSHDHTDTKRTKGKKLDTALSKGEKLDSGLTKEKKLDAEIAELSKGKNLDTWISGTIELWEEMYGLRYCRAGGMGRGNTPYPVRTCPYPSSPVAKNEETFHLDQKIIDLPERKVLEVMLEIVGIRNLPEGHKGDFSISISKTQPDRIFNPKKSIFFEIWGKQISYFECEPSGHILLELKHRLPVSDFVEVMGSIALSLEDLICPASKLTTEKWLEVVPSTKLEALEPILVRVAVSVTVPTAAPYVLHLVRSRAFSKTSFFFPPPGRISTRVIDGADDEVISLQMRKSKKSKRMSGSTLQKEVIGIDKSGDMHSLAELVGKEWLLLDSHWSLKFQTCSGNEGYHLELVGGSRTVKFFRGQRLDYEQDMRAMRRNQDGFMTAIEFSSEHPYGKALALLNLKRGVINVKENWLLLPGIITAFILKKERYSSLLSSVSKLKKKNSSTQEANACNEEGTEVNKNSDAAEQRMC